MIEPRRVAVRNRQHSGPTFTAARSRTRTRETAASGSARHEFGAVHVLDQSELEAQPAEGGPSPAPAPVVPEPTPTPQPAGGGDASVKIPRIRGASSPKGTPDRIPPRVDTPVAIKITGAEASAPVTLSIDGAGGGNGSATINGKETVELTASEEVKLRGGIPQTERGKAGKLRLAAHQGGKLVASSEPFSVAAYPTAIGHKYYSLMRAVVIKRLPHWGARYEVTDPKFEHTPDADSGVHGDLDETTIAENVIVDSATGVYRGAVNRHSGFQRTTRTTYDHHGTGSTDAASLIAEIRKAGVGNSKQVSHQFHRFSCARSDLAEDIDKGPKVPTSGFKITHATSKSDSSFFIDVAKVGFANHGVAAGTVDDTDVKHAEIKD